MAENYDTKNFGLSKNMILKNPRSTRNPSLKSLLQQGNPLFGAQNPKIFALRALLLQNPYEIH